MQHPYQSSNLPLPLKIALRELRGGLKGFRVFLACLFLGVAAIAGVGSLTIAITQGLEDQGQTILGGDLEIVVFRKEAEPEAIKHFEETGVVARTTRLRAITKDINSDARTLTEVKAVDGYYPHYGELILNPPMTRDEALELRNGKWGAVIPPTLADRLRANIGDDLRVGNVVFELRSILEVEPDLSNEGLQMGPTIMIDYEAIPETELIKEGSLYNSQYKIKTPPELDLDLWQENLETQFPEAEWRVRDRSGSAPGVRRFVERMGMFLTLVGLAALVVGGVGVGNAVTNYLDSKTETIATFKILGATGGMVFKIYLIQVMALAFFAVVFGLIVGSLLPTVALEFVGDQIPIPPEVGLYPAPLITAAIYGVLITLAFAVWPLAKAQDVPAARLFRSLVSPDRHWPRKRYQFVVFGSAVLVIAMAIGFSSIKLMAMWFAIGAGLSLLFLRGLGWAIEKAASKLPRPRNPFLRMALANLHRPGAATGAVVLSLGLGLTMFATISLVEGNLNSQVESQIPDDAPAFFMIDIQKNQAEEFERLANENGGVTGLRMVPALRGRITAVGGVPSEEVEATGSRWVIRGDRNLTYSPTVPQGNDIIEGEWWPEDYTGEPLVSFAEEEARDLGIEVGTVLNFNILGRPIEAKVANLRRLTWGTMSFNHVVVFAPGTLDNAPHTYMASMNIKNPEDENRAHRTLTDAFPNVTAIRMKDVLETVNGMLEEIGAAVRGTAAIAILAGILVLAGALAAGHRHRVYDAVILKVLGAVRRDVLLAYILEYLALGLITGVVALGIGTLSGYLIITGVMEMEYVYLPAIMMQTVLGAIAATVFFGLLGTWKALGAKPVEVLRNP